MSTQFSVRDLCVQENTFIIMMNIALDLFWIHLEYNILFMVPNTK